MSTSPRIAAASLVAAAAATVGIGLAASAPASADTGPVKPRTDSSWTAPKSPQQVRTNVVKIVKQVVASLHTRPCNPAPAPAE